MRYNTSTCAIDTHDGRDWYACGRTQRAVESHIAAKKARESQKGPMLCVNIVVAHQLLSLEWGRIHTEKMMVRPNSRASCPLANAFRRRGETSIVGEGQQARHSSSEARLHCFCTAARRFFSAICIHPEETASLQTYFRMRSALLRDSRLPPDLALPLSTHRLRKRTRRKLHPMNTTVK